MYLGIDLFLSDHKPLHWLFFHGNEFWKDIPGWTDKYQVSTFGRIKNKKKRTFLRPFDRQPNTPRAGYMSVQLARITKTNRYVNYNIHSLVLLAFKSERPEGLVIHHKDHIRSNNRIYNIQYCTQSYNRLQDFKDGVQSFLGEKNNQAILNSEQVLEIIKLRKHHKLKPIADMFGMSVSGISGILNGHTWSHITGIKNKNKNKNKNKHEII